MSSEPANDMQSRLRPSRQKKLSSAAVVASQVKAKTYLNKSLVPLVQTRVERSLDLVTGNEKLTAIFPRHSGQKADEVDLTFLLRFPNLMPMFVDAFISWGSPCAPSTRITSALLLNTGFFRYLEIRWHCNLAPHEIDDEVLIGFREHLQNNVGASGKKPHPSYIRSLLGALRYVLGALETGVWATLARHIMERVPPGPVGSQRKSEPIEVLQLEHLLLVLEASEKEILVIENRFERGRELVEQGRSKISRLSGVQASHPVDYSDLSVCLAELDASYPDIIPDLQVIVDENPPLGEALKYVHGHRETYSYLYATGRDLVPFVLLLCVATVFNAETILSLKWKNIDFDRDRAGTPVVEIQGVKGRAAEDPARLLDPEAAISSKLSLKRLLACLQNITKRIRSKAELDSVDLLFLYIPKVGLKQPKGFAGGNGGGYSIWQYSLKNFINDNSLPSFALGQLRPTILNLIQSADGSLEAAQRIGNHKNPITTWKHYTSNGVRKRYRERIGQIIVLRERWFESAGSIDPRWMLPEQDKGAATPGFSCLNPFDSPRPNQQRGKLCKDYGGCPSCPMAAAFPSDPVSVGNYTALVAAIYLSQPAMSAKTWFERWVPVLSDLAALLTLVPPEVLEESKKISFTLPQVG